MTETTNTETYEVNHPNDALAAELQGLTPEQLQEMAMQFDPIKAIREFLFSLVEDGYIPNAFKSTEHKTEYRIVVMNENGLTPTKLNDGGTLTFQAFNPETDDIFFVAIGPERFAAMKRKDTDFIICDINDALNAIYENKQVKEEDLKSYIRHYLLTPADMDKRFLDANVIAEHREYLAKITKLIGTKQNPQVELLFQSVYDFSKVEFPKWENALVLQDDESADIEWGITGTIRGEEHEELVARTFFLYTRLPESATGEMSEKPIQIIRQLEPQQFPATFPHADVNVLIKEQFEPGQACAWIEVHYDVKTFLVHYIGLAAKAGFDIDQVD